MNSTVYTSAINYPYLTNRLNFYCSLTILPIGIIMNFFTAIIFAHKPFGGTSLGFITCCLSIIDFCALSFAFLNFLPASINKDLQNLNTFSCKTINYFRRFFIKMVSWYQVLITIDRTMCIVYNYRFRFWLKKRFLVLIMALMMFFLGILFMADGMYDLVSVEIWSNITNKTAITHRCRSTRYAAFFSDVVSTTFR
jgi:hypothetical protein